LSGIEHPGKARLRDIDTARIVAVLTAEAGRGDLGKQGWKRSGEGAPYRECPKGLHELNYVRVVKFVVRSRVEGELLTAILRRSRATCSLILRYC
jgi:hypothetical protein